VQQQKQPPKPAQNTTPGFGNFFGGGGFGNTAPAPRQVAPPGAAPRPPANGAPRPPANVGRSAAVPPPNPTR
jgi:hypothetical protein